MPGSLGKGPLLRRLLGLGHNLCTARSLGLTVPLIIQMTADEVIECNARKDRELRSSRGVRADANRGSKPNMDQLNCCRRMTVSGP
jgi:hypothetical protein